MYLSNKDTVEEFWNSSTIESCASNADSDSHLMFKNSFSSFIGSEPELISFFPSGQLALQNLLESRKNHGSVVLLTAFNCSVVKTAILASGSLPKFYDFNHEPGNYDWVNLIKQFSPEVGVIIITHYYGVPVDFRAIQDYCEKNDILIIEDCAHTLGGKIDGRDTGTIGDASVFSFNYDKPISLGWGGISVLNKPHKFNESQTSFCVPNIDEELLLLEKFTRYLRYRRKMITNPNSLLHRILNRIKLLKSREFKKPHNISIGAVQAELGCWCINHYKNVLNTRIKNAEHIANSIPQKSWYVSKNVKPAWVKQKVLINDVKSLNRLSHDLQKSGLRIGNFNWPELLSPEKSLFLPFSYEASLQWIDVPVHQNLVDQDLKNIIQALTQAN